VIPCKGARHDVGGGAEELPISVRLQINKQLRLQHAHIAEESVKTSGEQEASER
jgi:hypothetical protein